MEEDITALQENLLLYVDEELNHADKKTIEAILATDIAAQKEWTVLQQTKLQPDMEVVFADKQSLYRKEPGRVVAFKWCAMIVIELDAGLNGGVWQLRLYCWVLVSGQEFRYTKIVTQQKPVPKSWLIVKKIIPDKYKRTIQQVIQL